jgi:hypothetical protein
MVDTAHRICRSGDDPDLAAVVDAWAELPEGFRNSILMLVNAATRR